MALVASLDGRHLPPRWGPYVEGREGSLFPKASGDHNKERCDFRSEERRTKQPPRDVSGQQPVYVCTRAIDRSLSLSLSCVRRLIPESDAVFSNKTCSLAPLPRISEMNAGFFFLSARQRKVV